MNKPLMLSDTAMALLRQYNEASETEALRLTYVKKMSLRAGQKRAFITSPQLKLIAQEFMLELKALWVCRDLVPIRQLDQHFALSDDLLAQALTQLSHHDPHTGIHLRLAAFVDHVAWAYQATLTIHIQSPSLEEDHSCVTNP